MTSPSPSPSPRAIDPHPRPPPHPPFPSIPTPTPRPSSLPPLSGFIDESMKNDGFVPLYLDRTDPTQAGGGGGGGGRGVGGEAGGGVGQGGEGSLSSSSTPQAAGTFQTIVAATAPAVKPTAGAVGGEGGDGEFACPCCGLTTTGGMSYHAHVTQCYMSRYLTPSRSQPSSPRASSGRTTACSSPASPHSLSSTFPPSSSSFSSSSPTASVASLRECVNQLGLHTRLSLMEAFFRLSRSTATAEVGGEFPVEEKLISLLYSPAPLQGVSSASVTCAASASPASTASVTSSPSYRYSPDIERPFSPSSYSSQVNEAGGDSLDLLHPHTPAQSPPHSPRTPHTCLTPALHQWEMGEGKEEAMSSFSLPASDHLYPSAPSSPSHAVKRARALSQPAIPYFDDLHTLPSSSSSNFDEGSRAHLTSPIMRSYSPVQVHPQAFTASPTYFHTSSSSSSSSPPSSSSSSSSSSFLHAPVPVPANSRRHSVGPTHRTRPSPKSAKNIFKVSAPSSTASALPTPKKGRVEVEQHATGASDRSEGYSQGAATKQKRRKRETTSQ